MRESETQDMWVIYRTTWGGNPAVVAAFATEKMATDWKDQCEHRRADVIRRQSVTMNPLQLTTNFHLTPPAGA